MRWGKLLVLGALGLGNVLLFVAFTRSGPFGAWAVVDLWLLHAIDAVDGYVLLGWVAWGVFAMVRDRRRRRGLVVEGGHWRGTWVVAGLVVSASVVVCVLAVAMAWIPSTEGVRGGAAVWGEWVTLWARLSLAASLTVLVPAAFEELHRRRVQQG